MPKKTIKKKIDKKKIDKANKSKTSKKVNKKSDKKNTEKDKYLAKWTAPEFIKTKEEIFWYCISVGAAALMVVWSSYQKNLIVAVTFFLLILVVIFQIYRRPRNIKYKIDLDGIIIEDVVYKYGDIKSFEVVRGDDFNVLKFRLKNAILPIKEIQLADQDSYYIRAALEYFLPEEEQKETLIGFENKNNIDEEYLSDEDFYEYLRKNK